MFVLVSPTWLLEQKHDVIVILVWYNTIGIVASTVGRSVCDPHHQMRHKSEILKLRFWHNVIEENIGLKMVKELCFYHNTKLDYN